MFALLIFYCDVYLWLEYPINFCEGAMMAKKNGKRDLSIGSTFLISTGADSYPAQIKVLSRKGGKVRIQVSSPARPKTCPDCGHEHGLSVNAATGVVVCMTTGQPLKPASVAGFLFLASFGGVG